MKVIEVVISFGTPKGEQIELDARYNRVFSYFEGNAPSYTKIHDALETLAMTLGETSENSMMPSKRYDSPKVAQSVSEQPVRKKPGRKVGSRTKKRKPRIIRP